MLTKLQITSAKPKAKPYTLSDGQGLVLAIQTSGSKLWRLRYRYADRQKTLHIGPWPSTSLADAREKCREARKAIAAGLARDLLVRAAAAGEHHAFAWAWMKSGRRGGAPRRTDEAARRLERENADQLRGPKIAGRALGAARAGEGARAEPVAEQPARHGDADIQALSRAGGEALAIMAIEANDTVEFGPEESRVGEAAPAKDGVAPVAAIAVDALDRGSGIVLQVYRPRVGVTQVLMVDERIMTEVHLDRHGLHQGGEVPEA